MKYDHNQICTADHEIVVGGVYCFKEEGLLAEVEVLEIESNKPNWIGFLLRPIKVRRGYEDAYKEPFSVGATQGHYGYSGMWRLYDRDTYVYDGVTL